MFNQIVQAFVGIAKQLVRPIVAIASSIIGLIAGKKLVEHGVKQVQQVSIGSGDRSNTSDLIAMGLMPMQARILSENGFDSDMLTGILDDEDIQAINEMDDVDAIIDYIYNAEARKS